MHIVFGELHLLMLGTELEALLADLVSFELCLSLYLRASCVHSVRLCGLYSFIINVLLLFECRWSHSLQILLHVRNRKKSKMAGKKKMMMMMTAVVMLTVEVIMIVRM